MYHSNGIGSQLEARIHVYDGRLWVDRGGGSKGESSMDDSDDLEDGTKDSSSKEQLSSSSQQEDDEDVEPRSLTGNDVITDDDDEKEKKTQSSSLSAAATVDGGGGGGGGGGNWESRTATISQLLVDKAQMTHSGRYICSAVGSSGTWTHVHILPGNNQFIIVYFGNLLFYSVCRLLSAVFNPIIVEWSTCASSFDTSSRNTFRCASTYCAFLQGLLTVS